MAPLSMVNNVPNVPRNKRKRKKPHKNVPNVLAKFAMSIQLLKEMLLLIKNKIHSIIETIPTYFQNNTNQIRRGRLSNNNHKT